MTSDLVRNWLSTGDEDGTAPGEARTSWDPVDLTPYLDGTYERSEPTIGLARTDGVRLIYPAKEHAIIGETESGKSWYCLASVLAEIQAGRTVVYIHFEEADPAGTVERLQALGATRVDLLDRFVFVGPDTPITDHTRDALLSYRPSLVILDGVNEAMALMGHGIYEADGVAKFRASLVKPFTAVGAAVLAADHVVKAVENRRRDAFGSVHKGNALDGCRILLENVRPFGRGKEGMSRLYVTKDRPGYLRAHGIAGREPGRTYLGDLVVNDDREKTFRLRLDLFPPPQGDQDSIRKVGVTTRDRGLEDAIIEAISGTPSMAVDSFRELRTLLRTAKKGKRDADVQRVLDDLVSDGKLIEVENGPRKCKGYVLASSTVSGDDAA